MRRPRCPYDIAFRKNGQVVPLFCGRWACPRCAKRNAAQWAVRVFLQIEANPGVCYHMTLTLRPEVKTPAEGFRLLPRLWDTLRKKLQREKAPQKWLYCAFVECHPKRGKIPHFHIISVGKPAQRWKDFAYYAGFGYQAWCKPVDSRLGAWYVSKYVGKGDDAVPKGFRRVRASREWAKSPKGEHAAYIVRARGESVGDYIARVASETGKVPEEEYALYALAYEAMKRQWRADRELGV